MKVKFLFALLAVFALLAAACGDDDDESTGDSSSEDTAAEDSDTDDTAAEDSGTDDAPAEDTGADDAAAGGGAAAVDIDAVLAVDLDACEEAPTGDAIKVGMAMDFGEVSGFADIPGSQAVEHLAALINCAGGINGSPVEVQVQDIQGDPEVTARATQDLLDFGAHFLIGPPFADFGQPVLQVTEGLVPVFLSLIHISEPTRQ